MTPERKNFLAVRIAPSRRIVGADRNADGNHYRLECGHTTTHAPHFALSKIGSETRCISCGHDDLPNHPIYGREI